MGKLSPHRRIIGQGDDDPPWGIDLALSDSFVTSSPIPADPAVGTSWLRHARDRDLRPQPQWLIYYRIQPERITGSEVGQMIAVYCIVKDAPSARTTDMEAETET